MQTTTEKKAIYEPGIFPIKGTDHIEFYVGNAKQAAHYYQAAWGYRLIAYRGPETGDREKVSYVLQQGKIRLVLTASLRSEHEVARHVHRHGDGVKSISFWVEDAEKAYNTAIARGAESAFEPLELSDEYGSVKLAAIKTYGETIHTFVERDNYQGAFLPGFEARQSIYPVKPVGLKVVDHCVGNVNWGEMNKWAKFYEQVLSFKTLITFDDKDISTEYTALMSKVMTNDNGYIKFPINEPAKGKKKSQIEEYIEFYNGPGVQHIAVLTDDIISTIRQLRANGVDFLYVPDTYYDTLEERVGQIDEDIETLKELNILVDRDDSGYLLQLFSKPVEDRPTLFYEIIQRKGARSFGKGNFQALFESIEREQALRGTL